MRWDGEMRNEKKILVADFGSMKRPLVRPKHRWGNSIKTVVKEIGNDVDGTQLAWDRNMWILVQTEMNIHVP
jgi:hypothetical protein